MELHTRTYTYLIQFLFFVTTIKQSVVRTITIFNYVKKKREKKRIVLMFYFNYNLLLWWSFFIIIFLYTPLQLNFNAFQHIYVYRTDCGSHGSGIEWSNSHEIDSRIINGLLSITDTIESIRHMLLYEGS